MSELKYNVQPIIFGKYCTYLIVQLNFFRFFVLSIHKTHHVTSSFTSISTNMPRKSAFKKRMASISALGHAKRWEKKSEEVTDIVTANSSETVSNESADYDIGFDNEEDWETLGLTEERMIEFIDCDIGDSDSIHRTIDINDALHCQSPVSGSKRKGFYSKSSRTTQWRRRTEAAKVDPKGKLTSFGFTLSAVEEEEVAKRQSAWEIEVEKIIEMMDTLMPLIVPVMNNNTPGSTKNCYQSSKYRSVYFYFTKRLEGFKKYEASKFAASMTWLNHSEDYRPKIIRAWAKEFLMNGVLSPHRQGVHVKKQSFLSDADVKEMVLKMIRETKPEQRSPLNIKKHVDEVVAPSLLGVNVQVSEKTVRNYMHEWGYMYRKNKKDIYFDGHEREDVVKYRQEWSKRMVTYMEKMDFFSGENEESVLEPVLEEGEKKIVLVTHDESTFYAHDSRTDMWLENDESIIRKKGPGRSIMVSEFQCPCHGTMKIRSWMSRKFFKAGSGRDGWWTSADMIKQLKEDAIPLFEALHPDCVGVFLFDQSSNHQAYADDALVASRMTLKEKPAPLNGKFNFRDTAAKLTDQSYIQQTFYYEKNEATPTRKGKERMSGVRYFKGMYFKFLYEYSPCLINLFTYQLFRHQEDFGGARTVVRKTGWQWRVELILWCSSIPSSLYVLCSTLLGK